MGKREEIRAILEERIRFSDKQLDRHNLMGYCPFHKDGMERTPSFFVYVGPPAPKKSLGVGFCHTCGQAWSLSTLLKKLDINRANVDAIVEIAAEETPYRSKNYYDSISLVNPRLPEAILGAWDYAPTRLLRDGFEKETLRYFDIGFDRRSKRITFPIRDHTGTLIGVSGRTVTGENPRYKVYRREFDAIISGYALDKSRSVWGLDKFYYTALNKGLRSPVVVCEGFKACMWVYQAGFENSTALMGTYCSPEQKMLLTRVSNEVILFLDNDTPGRRAMGGISNYLNSSLSVWIADYPEVADGYSPDDLSPDIIQTAIENKLTKTQWRKKWAA